jgi:hypothetical protein
MDGLLGRRINAVYAVALIAFLAHQVLIHLDCSTAVLDAYLDPLCTVPVVLGLPSAGAQYVWPGWRLPWAHTLVFTLVLAVVFEWAVPRNDLRFTSDRWDVLAYALGALAWRWNEPKLR